MANIKDRASANPFLTYGYAGPEYFCDRKQETAENGDIVVALIEDSATVKRFYKKNGYYILHPENETMADIVVNEVSILGKVVGLVRSFR